MADLVVKPRRTKAARNNRPLILFIAIFLVLVIIGILTQSLRPESTADITNIAFKELDIKKVIKAIADERSVKGSGGVS